MPGNFLSCFGYAEVGKSVIATLLDMANNSGPGIKYVIVVMLENRSYDNVLGWLYNPSNAAAYQYQPPGQSNLNGLGCNNINPNPAGPSETPILANNVTELTTVQGTTTTAQGTNYPPTAVPVYDPGEWFGDMAQQITGSASIPSSNPYDPALDPPYTPQAAGLMQGFTLNYVEESYSEQQSAPSAEASQAISYLTPAQLPVTSFLAANFGVCDQWFASAPAQTYVNRAFALTAAPGIGTQHDMPGVTSWVNDWVYVDPIHPPTLYTVPSILSQLDDVLSAPPNWKVYFHDYSIAMLTAGYVAEQAALSPNINVSLFDNTDYAAGTTPAQLTGALPRTFLDDLTANPPTLPSFSLIEPRYFLGYATTNSQSQVQYAPNSNHPGAAIFPPFFHPVSNTNPPIDVMSGELFLMQLYNTLQQYQSVWNETLLIITYDEHGGIYDHVPPPLATPPATVNLATPAPFPDIPAAQDSQDPVAVGFNYNVFGARVPAIIVSPLIAQASTIRDPNGAPFDHTSIIKTVWDLFNLSASPSTVTSLTARDAAAPSLVPFLSTTGRINNTGAFSGVLLSAPSFMVFSYSSGSTVYDQVLVACDGGSAAPTAACSTTDWLSIGTPTATGNALTVTVSLNMAHVPSAAGTYTGTIQITSTDGALPPTLDVAVTLVVT